MTGISDREPNCIGPGGPIDRIFERAPTAMWPGERPRRAANSRYGFATLRTAGLPKTTWRSSPITARQGFAGTWHTRCDMAVTTKALLPESKAKGSLRQQHRTSQSRPGFARCGCGGGGANGGRTSAESGANGSYDVRPFATMTTPSRHLPVVSVRKGGFAAQCAWGAAAMW